MLFDEDIAPSVIRRVLTHLDFSGSKELEFKYVCFYWLRHILAGEHLSSALFELTSASEPDIDNYVDFHAVEVTGGAHSRY